MIGFIQQLGRRTPLGWLQLSREKGRLLIAVSGIAFADVLMFMQLGFQSALYNSNTRLNRSLNTDIVLISPKAQNMQRMSTFSRRRMYQAKDIEGVSSTQGMYVNVILWKNPQTREEKSIQVIGINPQKPSLNLPAVNQQLQLTKLPDTFLFDRGTRGEYQQAIAQVEQNQVVTTEIEKRTIKIAGLFDLGSSFGADGNLITSDDNFLRLFPKQKASALNLALIKVKPGYESAQVAKEIKYHLREFDDVKVLTHEEFIQFENEFWATQSPIGFIFGLGTAMGFLVGVIIVYQVLSTDVNAHIKEYATFKAMGYHNRYLLTIVIEEAIILALLGFIPGMALPMWLYQNTRKATMLPVYMTVSRALLVLTLTFVMCMISGVIATLKLQSADPADMF
ncbi:DevC protein [Rivularia sp. PCC 7116]|uniref:ABC transporter permease DevC n=1 Tax=Rivularia sp. PCC 7116 TaxID=373994 RepID=UPI00029F0C49|nr:ABC transporter permease DevC [Rivularia sp. PCC 7116]AFY56404.1 DevC protein [Rivularia sp. PCC 7116]